jgi:hypothetical protein
MADKKKKEPTISDPQVRVSKGVTIHDSTGAKTPRGKGEGVRIVRRTH